MVSEKKSKFYLDDVLVKFSWYGSYHRHMMCFLAFTFLTNSLNCTNYVFVTEDVVYRCKNTSFENDTCGTINSTQCTEWIYDDPNSFVAELACQDWKRTLVGTVHSFAYMVGLLFVGPFSDRFGRKPGIIAMGVIGGICGLARSFVTSYWLYIVLEFLESAFGDICSPAYILNVEIVAPKDRIIYFTLCGIGYFIGGVLKAIIAYLAGGWRNYLRILYAPSLLFFLYVYAIDESPRWLLIKGKNEEAIEIVQKMARKSNIKIDKNILDNLVSDNDKENNIKFMSVLKSTFMSPKLLKRFIVCIVWWATSTFVSYGMTITSVSLEGNKYLNFALATLIELPGSFILMFVLKKYKRKLPLIICFLIAGVFCIGQPFLPENMTWLSITMFMAGKMMVSLYFGITYLYTSEIFPTYTRNSMHALCSSLGRIGSILAPQLPLLTVYWDGLPSLIFGVTSVFAGLITFIVPDVSDDALPDTVKQAESLGIKVQHKTITVENGYCETTNQQINGAKY